MNNSCELVEQLKRLKKSSQEAVDDDKTFSDFKKYMHVKRDVEDRLIKVVENAGQLYGKSLVLVCGNVGDGKSHLISYLKNHENAYLDGFVIHNDATESFSRHKTERETLAKVLEDFNDDNFETNSNTKIIVAINLGVLSNFISSEEGQNFKHFAKYVNDNKILNIAEFVGTPDEDSNFFHVNFGDYHIFRLNNGKAESPFIKELINKIFTNNEANDFYSCYSSHCSRCELGECCPVKHNYEMLGESDIQDKIINILLETIIKDKLIVSTRDLLNFFYDICVHPDFSPSTYSKRSSGQVEMFMEYTIPSLMYCHDDISELLLHIKKYDTLKTRSEEFDSIVTRFNTTEKISDMFENNINTNSCTKYLLHNSNIGILDSFRRSKKSSEDCFSYFCHLLKLSDKNGSLVLNDSDYDEYVRNMYYIARKDKKNLKELYNMVEDCIYLWNGSDKNDYVNTPTSNEDYIISSELKVKRDLSGYISAVDQTVFYRFISSLIVAFKSDGADSKPITLSIDYDLYKMLKMVSTGYRPTAQDNNYYARFVSFVNQLVKDSKFDKEIIITHFVRDEAQKYILTYDDEYEEYEFKEVK